MRRFEDRLTRHLATLSTLALLGCGSPSKDSGSTTPTGTVGTGVPTSALEAMCDGGPEVANHLLYIGYVVVDPGTDCPDASVAQVRTNGCVFIDFTGVTCGFEGVDANQVFIDDGYGGYWVDAGSTPTGYTAGDPKDICRYEAVFFDDPDYSVTCGRPLLQDGQAVLAGVRTGADWADALPEVELGAGERAAVSAWWLAAARMEHASVASFAVCSLDLMRLGAPPELLHATHRAAMDEVVHARLCFALASRYGERSFAPAPMPEISASGHSDLGSFAEAVFREGCVGETLAAVDAAARLALATDPEVREALEIIVRDESDHAALAWRTLRWALGQDGDGSVRRRLEVAFAEEREKWTAPFEDASPVTRASTAHGLLPAGARSRELARAFTEIVTPTWTELR